MRIANVDRRWLVWIEGLDEILARESKDKTLLMELSPCDLVMNFTYERFQKLFRIDPFTGGEEIK